MFFSKLSERKGFWGVEFSDFQGSLQPLTSSHLRERDKMLLRAILCGGVWNGFFHGKAKKEYVPCRFCGKRDGDGHLFWECSFHPFNMCATSMNFHSLCLWIVVSGPGAYFGMVGCLVSMVCLVVSPGLHLLVSLASFRLEGCLGAYPVDYAAAWTPPDYWDADDIALEIYLSILTSGLMVAERISPLLVALKLLVLVFTFLLLSLLLIIRFGARLKSMVMLGLSVAVLFYLSLGYCKLFNVLNSGVLLLLCRLTGLVILELTIFNVVRSIGRLLDADCLAKPLPLVKYGDLIALVQYMIRTRGRDTVRVTKVKGHAKDGDVQHGHVRLIDQQGNVEADIAADLGRRHQTEVLIDARRRLLQARGYWYPVVADLHRFMIAIARVSVNHDGKGGTAPDPLVWDKGSKPKARKLAIRVNVDLASLPGPPGFLNSSWIVVHAGHITSADISAWPKSVDILVRFTSFLGTLHWPSGSLDLGHFGISFLELLIAMGWSPIAW